MSRQHQPVVTRLLYWWDDSPTWQQWERIIGPVSAVLMLTATGVGLMAVASDSLSGLPSILSWLAWPLALFVPPLAVALLTLLPARLAASAVDSIGAKRRKVEPMQEGSVIFFSAAPLFGIARRAYERTNDAASDTDGSQTDALVAVVFAAAALEAFMNEVGKLAAVRSEANPPFVKILGDVLEEIEESDGGVRLKFLLARAVLAGEAYDKGSQPYQDFALLFALRNHLVHMRPREQMEYTDESGVSFTPPKIVERLRSKNILAKVDADAATQFIVFISTRAVARWACNVAAEMLRSLLAVVPDSRFRQDLESFYGRYFERVE
jgi:hypothetical protein